MTEPGTAAELIAALLAVTPEPATDVEPELVIEVSTRILALSAPLMAALRAAQGDAHLPAALAADARLLLTRTQRWLALAEDARREIAGGLRGLSQARHYEAHR